MSVGEGIQVKETESRETMSEAYVSKVNSVMKSYNRWIYSGVAIFLLLFFAVLIMVSSMENYTALEKGLWVSCLWGGLGFVLSSYLFLMGRSEEEELYWLWRDYHGEVLRKSLGVY